MHVFQSSTALARRYESLVIRLLADEADSALFDDEVCVERV
jgi:hypothetical protein